MYQDKILVRQLGLQPYEPISQAMHEFTDTRDDSTLDEIWLVEHYPVFTQGQAGKAEHCVISASATCCHNGLPFNSSNPLSTPPIRLALPPASTTPVIVVIRFTDIASFIVGLTLLTCLSQE